MSGSWLGASAPDSLNTRTLRSAHPPGPANREGGTEGRRKGWHKTGQRQGLQGRLWAPRGSYRGPVGALDVRGKGSGATCDCSKHTSPCAARVSRAGGTMRLAGRAALLTALLLLAQLRPGSSQWSPKEAAAAAGVQDPSLRGSPGARNQGRGARALLLLLAERFPRRAGPGRWGSGTTGERPRRDDPPLSIDLTFHMLRTLLEMARTQSQRERAEQNRVILDSVGK